MIPKPVDGPWPDLAMELCTRDIGPEASPVVKPSRIILGRPAEAESRIDACWLSTLVEPPKAGGKGGSREARKETGFVMEFLNEFNEPPMIEPEFEPSADDANTGDCELSSELNIR